MENTVLNFNDCTLTDLDKRFGLRWSRPLPQLNEWLDMAAAIELSDYEIATCQNLRNLLDLNVFYWREQDLSLHFIGPIFSLINFTEPYRYNLFAQRFIQATIPTINGERIELMGKPDEILASGYGEPEMPFFAFNEFKKEVQFKGDPAGQVLSAMLVGQHLNDHDDPIYGCYVLGRDWYFVVLTGKMYHISKGFDGTTDDVFGICRMLKALKEIVKKRTALLV
jgi:hypothetical protein